MKKFKFALLTFMTALISLSFTACSDDDDLKNVSDDRCHDHSYHINTKNRNYRNTDCDCRS